VPVYHEGRLRLPLYARAGAIIPRMHVDARTTNVLGRRRDGSVRDELVVRVYPAAEQTRFTLHEDDGETVAYETGALAATLLSQRLAGSRATVTIAARTGTYAGAPARRDRVVELVVGPGRRAGAVRVDGALLRQVRSREAFDRGGESVWFDGGDGLVLARSGTLAADRATTFEFTLVR
jgi:alpha-glucosidase